MRCHISDDAPWIDAADLGTGAGLDELVVDEQPGRQVDLDPVGGSEGDGLCGRHLDCALLYFGLTR